MDTDFSNQMSNCERLWNASVIVQATVMEMKSLKNCYKYANRPGDIDLVIVIYPPNHIRLNHFSKALYDTLRSERP